MSLAKLVLRDCESTVDAATGVAVFHVRDPQALVQAAGYLKYLGASDAETVYFRGQTQIYPTMSPALFRGCTTPAAQSGRKGRLSLALRDLRSKCPILGKFDEPVHEPLLQHYGLKTTWIDLVDNVWVALWFACYQIHTAGHLNEFIRFERRVLRKESTPAYAFIALVASDAPQYSVIRPGHFLGPKTELVDLRLSCPSVFLRPHAQHGVLLRIRGDKSGARPIDYSSQIRGVLRIDLADALDWLGDGQMLGVSGLFPPPHYDYGYGILLDAAFAGDKAVGTIAITSV